MKFEKYHLGQGPEIKVNELPGKNAREMLSEQNVFESNNRSYPRSLPLVPRKAKGSIVEDVDGNKFMDFFSFCGVLNVGHGNEDVIQDVTTQLNDIVHALDFPTEVKLDFMRNLNKNFPTQLREKVKINFCGPTGADAVEAAMKLARLNTKRNIIISFQGAFHGMTVGALSVTSNLKNRKGLPVINNATHFAPYGYCYRCPFGKKSDSCKVECASYLKNLIENPNSGVDKPAAILLEPIQAEAGNIVPKPEFLQEIQKICNNNDIIMICDEVQVGFYRTGPLFSFEHFNVTPDMITMSKAIGGIGLPLSLLIIKNEFDIWQAGMHSGTFRGHQLGIAGGNSALNFIKKNNVELHVQEMGAILLDGLNLIQKKSKYIGDVRGLGLLLGVEYVRTKENKEPFPEYCLKLKKRLFQKGVLIEIGGHYSNVIRILPPLITTTKMIYSFIEIFDQVNWEIDQEYIKTELSIESFVRTN
jgi:diaminobutyrate-2-oxoglutarate transaminase